MGGRIELMKGIRVNEKGYINDKITENGYKLRGMEGGNTICIIVLPAISRALWTPKAVETCSVKKGAIMTRSNGAGPYPKAKQMTLKRGLGRIEGGIRRNM